MGIEDCRIIELPQVHDPRGNLTFIESGRDLPFEIKRVYYLYDVPAGAARGGHGHKTLHQLIIAMSGSFDVVIDDGHAKRRLHLSCPYYGLYICPMVWREIDSFSSVSVCLVLASDIFQESDYYREYQKFLDAANEERSESCYGRATDLS
jgi:hypothetical protein